jgi:hypothetical protein
LYDDNLFMAPFSYSLYFYSATNERKDPMDI